MPVRKYSFILLPALGVLLLAGVILFWPSGEANAQCGSQASSCKNCHEVQAQDPVNNDGTGWHQSHAFGDFCYICHAGNNQSMDKAEAHTGMVPVFSDVQAGCASCHPNDLMERAEVYAVALGVEVNSGGAASSSGGAPAGGSSGSAGADSSGAQAPAPAPILAANDADVIDYVERYNENVLGVRTVNWGNVIVGALIAVVAVGGGAFVYTNERKLRGLPLKPTAKTPAAAGVSPALPKVEGYDAEVTALLPLINQLDPLGRAALKRLLQNPAEASQLLHSLARLDPELVRRLRSLDRESRALLLALGGD